MGWLANPHRFGASQPSIPVGARPYWRVWIMGAADNFFHIVSLEFAATPGGADQCSGGSAVHAGFTNPASAFDGNTGTAATRSSLTGNDTVWLGYAFPSPVAVQEVRVRAGTSTAAQAPKAFFVEASDDGVTWNGVSLCLSAADYTSGEVKAFPVTPTFAVVDRAAAQVWRVNVTANNNGWSGIAEIEYRAASGGPDLCVGGVAGSDRSAGGSSAAKHAFDNDNNTYYSAGTAAVQCKVWYCFPTPPNPTHMALRARNNSTQDTPKDWTVEWSVDGHNWFVAATIAGQTGWANSEIREFSLP